MVLKRSKEMSKTQTALIKAVIAGILVGIGGILYVSSQDKLVGSFYLVSH